MLKLCMMRTLLAVLLCGCAAETAAVEVYRWVDAEGNVIYSDTPAPGAEKVEISEPTIVPGKRPQAAPPATVMAPEQAVAYESVSIASPANEETVRDNTGRVAVSVALVPELQHQFGHKLQLLIDGRPAGPPGTTTIFTLEGIPRGVHTLQAMVFDENDTKIEQSDTVTFFLHRHSILHPKPRSAP